MKKEIEEMKRILYAEQNAVFILDQLESAHNVLYQIEDILNSNFAIDVKLFKIQEVMGMCERTENHEEKGSRTTLSTVEESRESKRGKRIEEID